MTLKDKVEKIFKEEMENSRYCNTPNLRKNIRGRVSELLFNQFPEGRFYSNTLGRFHDIEVICDERNNPPSVVELRNLKIDIFPQDIWNHELEEDGEKYENRNR